MFVPTDKYCPFGFGRLAGNQHMACIGELCAWFDTEAKQCGVLSSLRKEPAQEKKPTTTRKTTKAE